MLRTLFFALAGMFFCCSMATAQENIVGLWKTVDEKTNKPQSVVAVYEYHGKYYGRMLLTYNDKGEINDTIYHRKERAPGIEGHPYYAGLDLIWDVKKIGKRFKDGKIVDPQHGKIYDVEMWVQDKNLIVRGEVLFFGRNQTWLPVSKQELPSEFQNLDTLKFTPVIPKVKE